MTPRVMMSSILLAVVLAGAAAGQGVDPARAQYAAEMTGTDVAVRSGPGVRYYECMKLSRPARVTVVGTRGDWLKILPPPGSYCVVNKDHVRVDATGGSATVTSDDIWARTGWRGDRPTTLMLSWPMKAGDKVSVSGQVGEYYKIVPPKGAYLWVSSQYVRRASQTAPTPIATTRSATAVAVVTPTPPTADPAVAALLALDKELTAEYKKPRPRRDLVKVLTRYKALKSGRDGVLKPYIAARIKFIESDIQRIIDVRATRVKVKETEAEHQRFLTALLRLEVGSAPALPVNFAAEGVVAPSTIYTGSAAIAKRFMLRAPKALRLVAYVRSTSGGPDMSAYVGKHVGVYGDSRYDSDAGVNVIDVLKVVELADQTAPAALPKPVLKPVPPPPPAEPTTKPAAKKQ